ncbi:MAG: hypothetical protein JEZ08_00415 [Clostridiales bacterium]|nr:hypothetical protein [Clostridiales bacterium]
MNLFLTGPMQIGKTTLLNLTIQRLNVKTHGFYTKPYYNNKTVLGYKMFDCSSSIEPFIIGLKDTPTTCRPLIENFETFGVSLLHTALASDDVIILDELGILESKAYKFQEAILKCLDSDNLVIGVIKNKQSTFLNKIKNRKDVITIEVTRENRNELLDKIMILLNEK